MSEEFTGLKSTMKTIGDCDEFGNAEVDYDVITGCFA